MANQSAKRRVEENKRRIQNLRILIFLANAWYILLRCVLFSSSLSWFIYMALASTTTIYLICFTWIQKASEPTYRGEELIDGGSNLSMGGILEYNHDLIYLCALGQLLGAFSDWSWLIFLVVPFYGIYQCCTKLVIPFTSAPPQGSGHEYDEKLARSERRKDSRRTKAVRR